MSATMLVREALHALGIEDLVLGVHDACFPSAPGEDVGRGTPYGNGARALLDFAQELGFTAVQLGPQGETSDDDPSPYDGAVFTRTHRSIALAALVDEGLLARDVMERLAGDQTFDVSDHVRAGERIRSALDHVRAVDVSDFVARERAWLERDALFEAIATSHGGRDFADWPTDRELFDDPSRVRQLQRVHAASIERFERVQWIAHEQHAALRAYAKQRGIALLGDMQIGWSRRDLWAWRHAFVRGLRMGAPPSRTNPEGQPWGYAVLDPELGPEANALFELRLAHELSLYDGLRIDHPHGLVCSWVYDEQDPDPLHAVQNGTRLHESPDRLPRYAYVREDQLDRALPRHHDHWARALEPAQIERYAQLLDRIAARASHVVCEVLSTLPNPLAAVLERHHLGRFRVTQKASLTDPSDVYRSENARPEDWIMVGNHDTDPIRVVARRWFVEGKAEAHAARLSVHLAPPHAGLDRGAFVQRVANDPAALAQAALAELFVSPARHVYVWWNDLFGDERRYNLPGSISPANWSIRIPADFRAAYAQRGFDLQQALALALRARDLRPDLANALASR